MRMISCTRSASRQLSTRLERKQTLFSIPFQIALSLSTTTRFLSLQTSLPAGAQGVRFTSLTSADLESCIVKFQFGDTSWTKSSSVRNLNGNRRKMHSFAGIFSCVRVLKASGFLLYCLDTSVLVYGSLNPLESIRAQTKTGGADGCWT